MTNTDIKKISGLTEVTTLDDDDLLVIEPKDGTPAKKVKKKNLGIDTGPINMDDIIDGATYKKTENNFTDADKAKLDSLTPGVDGNWVFVGNDTNDYSTLGEAITAGEKDIIIRDNYVSIENDSIVVPDGIRILGIDRDTSIVRQANPGKDLLQIYANGTNIQNVTWDCGTNSAQAAVVIGDGSTAGTPNVSVGNDNVFKGNRVLGNPTVALGSGIFALFVAGASYSPGADTLTAFDNENLQSGNIIEDNIIESAWEGDGASFSLQKNGSISNNKVVGTRIAFYMCVNSQCSNNDVVDSASNGVFVATPHKSSIISGNTVSDSVNSGITIQPQVEHTPVTDDQKRNFMTILGNTVRRSGNHGLEINNSNNNAIGSNTFDQVANHGIYLQQCKENTVDGNTIINPRYTNVTPRGSGIYMVSNVIDNVISDNTITDTLGFAQGGIVNREGGDCTGNAIISNTIKGIENERAVWFQSNYTDVSHNNINGGAFAGILFEGVSFSKVIGNKCSNNTQDANNAYANIWIKGSSTNNTIAHNQTESSDVNKAAWGVYFDSAGDTSNKYGDNIDNGAIQSPVQDNGTQNFNTEAQELPELFDKFNTSTSLIYGGEITQASATSVDISAGECFIVDKYTDPANPVVNRVSFGPFSNVQITGIASSVFTAIDIDLSGNVVQRNQVTTSKDLRERCVLGLIVHSNNASINSVNYQPFTTIDTDSTVTDLFRAVGPLNERGNIYGPAGTDRQISKTEGQVVGLSVNYSDPTDPENYNPNTKTTPAQEPVPGFIYTYKDGSGGWSSSSATNLIDSTVYDNGSGTLVPIAGNDYVLQRIYYFADSEITVIHHGQEEYNTMDEALAGIVTEDFEENPELTNAIFRGYLAVRGNTPDLSNENRAKFRAVGKFGGVTGSSGGGSISTGTVWSSEELSITGTTAFDLTHNLGVSQTDIESGRYSVLCHFSMPGPTGKTSWSGQPGLGNLVDQENQWSASDSAVPTLFYWQADEVNVKPNPSGGTLKRVTIIKNY